MNKRKETDLTLKIDLRQLTYSDTYKRYNNVFLNAYILTRVYGLHFTGTILTSFINCVWSFQEGQDLLN